MLLPTEDAPLPDDWTELVDEATGKHVYYNTMNGNISFDRPEGGDREWEDGVHKMHKRPV